MFIHEQLVLKRINDVQAVLGRPSVEDEVLSCSDCSTFLYYLFPERTCLRQARPLPSTPKAPAPRQQKLAQEHGAFKRRKAVMMTTFLKKTLASAYFPTQEYAVSWAMKSLTAEFGMGSGIPSSLWTPRKYVNV